MKVTASAPAKVILCGEHAVVFYEPAIVMAINRKASVTVEERRAQSIHIKSRELGISGLYEGSSFKPEAGGLEAKPKLDPIRMAVTKTLELTKERVG